MKIFCMSLLFYFSTLFPTLPIAWWPRTMGMAWWGRLCGEPCRAFLFAEHLRPPFFDIKPVSIDVALGESATFKCHVTGSAPMRITWTRDNREIRPGGNYKMTLVENTASLTVLKVGKGDAGLYTCTASNSVGKDACAAQLAVQGIAVGFSVYEVFFARQTPGNHSPECRCD